MPDYRTFFDRDYLGAFDLEGKDVTVTIARVEGVELAPQKGRKKAHKPACFFEGKEKGLLLNKTNAKQIAALYGNKTEGWIGKRITIFPTTTDMAGETVECLRVRPRAPGAAPAPRPAPSKSIGDESAVPPEELLS